MSSKIILTGVVGLFASILVGIGEYLLHYDSLARFSEGGFVFMRGIGEHRTTIGHFFGVFGATLYPVGCYHIYLMLRPANQLVALTAFFVGSFGCIVGAVWIGSRASVSALTQLPETEEVMHLIQLYDLRYETLINVTRITTLVLSAIFIFLSLTGRSYYKRWAAIFSPIALIIDCCVIYVVIPQIGKHLMPIALNVAFFIFFILSIIQAPSAANSKA